MIGLNTAITLRCNVKVADPRAIAILVSCSFDIATKNSLAHLKQGQAVTIEGELVEVSGGIVGTVSLTKCRLIS